MTTRPPYAPHPLTVAASVLATIVVFAYGFWSATS